MNILVTGAHGFVGKNLVAALEAVRDGKDRTRGALQVGEVDTFGSSDTPETLEAYCRRADFVFHLVGVNRPKEAAEFQRGNAALTQTLLETLQRVGNPCPVMLASSVQAVQDNPYGVSKRAAEELVRAYGAQTGARTCIYRFPNLFGKWCRPNYNSVVATFCHNIAHDLPITIHDEATVLTLAYIDDVVDELIRALSGTETREGALCTVPVTHTVSLGALAALLRRFHAQPETLLLPEMPAGSFAKKLYATYLSYLPEEKTRFPLTMHTDARGSFTELLRTAGCGQVSVNISKPGVTKGQHWHNTKWEFFIVVSGLARIRERRIDSDTVRTFDVSGEKIEAVHMLPGYTHSITNLSDTDDLVTVMWANEPFDAGHPDTFFEEV